MDRRAGDIDRLLHGRRPAAMAHSSTAVSSKGEQCRGLQLPSKAEHRTCICYFGPAFFFKCHLFFCVSTDWNLKTSSSAIAEEPREASCQLKSCQLPRNSAETTCTRSPEEIEVMKLKG